MAGKIGAALVSFDLMSVRETMRKPILLDILRVLCSIRTRHTNAEIEGFISNALTGGVLPKRAKKQIEDLLEQA